MKSPFVSIIVPVFNDRERILPFISAVTSVLRPRYSQYEILLVDHGSSDGSMDVVDAMLRQIPSIRAVALATFRQQEIAISAGMDMAIGDVIVAMDLRTDPPEKIPAFVQAATEGKNAAFGICTNLQESLLVRRGSWIFHWYCRTFLHLQIPKHSVTFFALTRQALNAILRTRTSNHYIRLFQTFTGIAVDELPYEKTGPSPESFRDKSRIALDFILSHSSHPLRLIVFLGILASGLNLLYMMYVVMVYLFKDQVVEGWTTTSLQSGLMFFLLFSVFAVFAEYLGKQMNDRRSKDQYVILSEKSSVVFSEQKERNIVYQSEKTYGT